ncbi:MAG: hypothetical protein LUQ07_02615 [Methanospirillum sp.]|nr:hypothetical protein [Methanospirillum sp.]
MTWRQLLAYLQATNENYTADTDTLYAAIHDSKLHPGEEIAIQTWTDSLRSNGGKISLNKNIDFDSKNKGKGLSNLEAGKVLTYASTEGAHLVGSEAWSLDVAGNWEKTADSIRCVFADAGDTVLPAFCNVVKAKSELVNFNNGQVSTKGSSRSVAATGDIPAALGYQIAVSPDANSGSGFADGTVKTLLGGSIMEAHGKNQVPAATNNWRDADSVTGGIKTFQKTFGYESGITGPGDKDNDQVMTITPTPTPGIGTIIINLPGGNLVGGTSTYSWVLSGPTSQSGYGSTTINDAIAGYYTIQIYLVSGVGNPVLKKTDSGTLTAGGTLTFTYGQ